MIYVEDMDGTQRPTGEVIAEGEAAQRLLDNPTFQGAVKRVEDSVTAEWREEQDPDLRERLWYELKGLESVVLSLRAAVSDGEFARHKASRDGQ